MLASVVLDVLKQAPGDDRAKHPMFESTLTWFKRANDMFSQLPDNVVSEMAKWCQFFSVPTNTVIIKQGDAADSFYAVLDGHASAWVVISAASGDDDLGKLGTITKGQQLGALDKNKLGICVKKYGPGGTFGELALLMPDGVRNASVVSDEDCFLATVARDLYNKLLLNYQRKEYEERLEICNASPLFLPLAKPHRQKLAMAMEKIHLEFDNFVSIQSQPALYLYFIVKGNAKVIVDPEMHMHQNHMLTNIKSLLTTAVRNQLEMRVKGRRSGRSTGAIMSLSTAGIGSFTFEDTSSVSKIEQQQHRARAKTAIELAAQRRGLVIKPGVQEVCWIHPGEVIGDAEAILGLDTYLWSVVAAEPMQIYALSLHNFRRIYNIYKSNENAALTIEQACYARLSERLQRIDTPICLRLLRHLKLNIEEASAFYHEANKPKLPQTPQARDWSEKLEAFRRRRMKTLGKREKIWTPPKPCVDGKTIQYLYEDWQEELKRAALMADENSDAVKALTKEEKKARILHQCETKVKKQRVSATAQFQQFTEGLQPDDDQDKINDDDGDDALHPHRESEDIEKPPRCSSPSDESFRQLPYSLTLKIGSLRFQDD